MKSICFIGARGGSKGVPKKNIRLLGGKPLISYAIESALNSNIFQDVIVSTDSEEIAKIAKKYGAEVPFMRPKKLATDKAGMYEVILHGINNLKSLGYDFDILVNRDCTVPFIRNKDIVGTINLLKKEKVDAVYGVYKQHHNPYFNMMEIKKENYMDFSKKLQTQISGRQNSPIVYQLNGLFVLNIENFLKTKKFYSTKTIPYLISPEHGFMIDTEFEFQIADMVAKKRIKLK